MKQLINLKYLAEHRQWSLSIFLICTLASFSLAAQKTDCTQDRKAQLAKNNMSPENDGLMCANAAQFYAYLCECKNNPRTADQARMMKATLQQIKDTYNSRGMPCKGIGRITDAIPNCKVGAKNGAGADGSNAQGTDWRQSYQNLRNAYNIANEAEMRHKNVARDLAQFAQISANGDPMSIMQQYQNNLNNIKNIDQQLRNEITNSTINNAVNVVSDYQSGNHERAFYGGLGMASAAFDNYEAKKEVERQKAELERKRVNAMRAAARKMIAINEEAANSWWESACKATEAEQEEYFRNMAYHYFAFANYISSNFSSSSVRWARNPRQAPAKPAFKSFYPGNAKVHHRAALRKLRALEEMKASNNHDPQYLDQWLEGALEQYSAAIDADPKNAQYYLELAEASRGYQDPIAIQSYIRAYQLRPALFGPSQKEHYQALMEKTEALLEEALQKDQPEVLRPYLYAGLYEVLKIRGEALWTALMRYQSPGVTDLLYTEELSTYTAKKRQEKLQAATLIAAEKGNLPLLEYLYERGFDFDYRYKNRRPLDAAAQFSQVETFRYLLYQSQDRERAQARFKGTGLLAMALAPRYPAEAAEQLCAIDQEQDWDNSLWTMLEDLKNTQKTATHYLQVLSRCARAHQAIKTDPALQQLAIERFEDDLRYRGASLSVRILEAEILDQKYLQSQQSTITRNALRQDNSALLAALKERELLATHDENGHPMAHYFTVFGQDILRSGQYQNFDLNARDQDGLSLAHKLVFSNRSTLLPQLAQSGPLKLNQPGPHGWTALHYATRENRTDLVEALLAAGADKSAEDEWGRTAYDIAKERHFKGLKKMLK